MLKPWRTPTRNARSTTPSLSAPIAFLQSLETSGKDAVAHECVLFGKVCFQDMRTIHVVGVGLGEVFPRVYARIGGDTWRVRGNFRDPAFLYAAADDEEKHEMADLVIEHVKKHLRAVERIDKNPPLPLDELALRLGARQQRAEGTCGRRRLRQIHDLAQAFQVEIRKHIDRTYDVVDRNEVLPRKTRQQEVQLASASRLSRGGPILDEQTHVRIS